MDVKIGYQGAIPLEGAFFDRVDVEGECHSRIYYLNGTMVLAVNALPDKDRPGKWLGAVRWMRRGAWNSHGWSQLDSEASSLSMIDAVGIGFEAATGGAVYLGNLNG